MPRKRNESVQSVDDIRKHLPKRFKRGQGLAGPEYFGCCNTGKRPVILRNPYKQGGHFFMVGPELDIDRFKHRIALDRVMGKKKRIYRDSDSCVHVYGTRSSAVERFLTLCDKIFQWNTQEREGYRKAREDARSSDPERAIKGALALADY